MLAALSIYVNSVTGMVQFVLHMSIGRAQLFAVVGSLVPRLIVRLIVFSNVKVIHAWELFHWHQLLQTQLLYMTSLQRLKISANGIRSTQTQTQPIVQRKVVYSKKQVVLELLSQDILQFQVQYHLL